MKFKLFASLFTSAVVTGICLNLAPWGGKTEVQAQSSSETQFICSTSYDPETKQRIPTTYAWLPNKKIPIIYWTSTLGSEEQWTPQKRCDEVSPRFDRAYKNGNINYFTNGRLNDEKVICTVREKGDDCTDDTLLLTLRKEDNDLAVLAQFETILEAEAKPEDAVQQTSSRHPDGTKRVYLGLDIEEFLETAPAEE